MNALTLAGIAITAAMLGYWRSARAAKRGTESAISNLATGFDDVKELSAKQTRQDVAAILMMIPITNAILAGILAVMIFK